MISKIPPKVADKNCTFNECKPIEVTFFPDKRFVTEQVKDERSNRIISRSKFQPIDNAAAMSKYRVSDFALENLIAIGANLQSCKLSTNTFASISNMEKQLSHIVEQSNTATE